MKRKKGYNIMASYFTESFMNGWLKLLRNRFVGNRMCDHHCIKRVKCELIKNPHSAIIILLFLLWMLSISFLFFCWVGNGGDLLLWAAFNKIAHSKLITLINLSFFCEMSERFVMDSIILFLTHDQTNK